MNIKRSIEMALASLGKQKKDLAEGIGISAARLSHIQKNNECKREELEKMADFCGMAVSGFIALGEVSE